MHPPYDPDVAPSDYYLFMSPILLVKHSPQVKLVKIYCSSFFTNRYVSFYESGIIIMDFCIVLFCIYLFSY